MSIRGTEPTFVDVSTNVCVVPKNRLFSRAVRRQLRIAGAAAMASLARRLGGSSDEPGNPHLFKVLRPPRQAQLVFELENSRLFLGGQRTGFHEPGNLGIDRAALLVQSPV